MSESFEINFMFKINLEYESPGTRWIFVKKRSAQKTKASVPLKDWWSSVGEVGTRYW
jgi:hypothetical protein